NETHQPFFKNGLGHHRHRTRHQGERGRCVGSRKRARQRKQTEPKRVPSLITGEGLALPPRYLTRVVHHVTSRSRNHRPFFVNARITIAARQVLFSLNPSGRTWL